MTIIELMQPFVELGFPIAIAVYLLWYQARRMDRFRDSIMKLSIGVHLVLSKLNSLEEYEGRLKEFEEAKRE